MSDTQKTYRIRTDIGSQMNSDYITVDANLVQDYDAFDILSVTINSSDTYKLHNANYGVVVGRVIANNGFGIPNAKLSIFIASDGEDGEKVRKLYSYTSSGEKNDDNVRYNLLPDEKVDDCHQIVGTFPNKRYALDNDVILEVFDKYYKYTTRTNNAGDFCIMGVPTGNQTLHMDLDLSDCGILSQRPRDFVYKGYTIEQFENPNMFKEGTDYPTLSQVFTQDRVVNVRPFWGNSSLGEEIGITRADIDVAFKFEPTCVFIGSVISDNASQGITKKCMATENMGNMEELVTGEGTIEMIRMTPAGNVEEFQVKGSQLINADGIWCYQIPMNLDYMMTDEYGNMVPTDDPEKGIPTRTRVRFRISMQDSEENVDNFFRAKALVPHNPQNTEDGHEDYDYEFGSFTREDSFRDLFWNNVYSVKSYIPRFQKRKIQGWKDKKFTGIKNCNFYGSNNPIPYNNIRIRLTFMFSVMCAIIKTLIFITGIINTMTSMLGNVLSDIGAIGIGKIMGIKINWYPFDKLYEHALRLKLSVLKEGLCPDLENWYFAPMWKANLWSDNKAPAGMAKYDLMRQTLDSIIATDGYSPNPDANIPDDSTSIDFINNQDGEDAVCLTISTEYLISCIEMNLAMEYRVINFDFYNDWLNGTIYFPRFMRYVRPKKTFLGITFAKTKVKGCMDDTSIFSKTRRYTQLCTLSYKARQIGQAATFTNVMDPIQGNKNKVAAANNYHKKSGFGQKSIFGRNGGICHEATTSKGQNVYYMKPCEWTDGTSPNYIKVNLFATDIILLGSLNDCDQYGIPQAFKYLNGTSYVLPTNLALTNMEENGALYANDKGTICTSVSEQIPPSNSAGNTPIPIKVIPQSEGLSGEIVYFSGGNDTTLTGDILYDGLELSDIIALTEAAGISWNFTGPGQGEADDTRMYTPGGHFLGLSCMKSQTNIKSCINLQRICEVGANMSQRREDVSGYDGDGELSYSYSVPSGFISGDDITGGDFRAMFATLNQNRLIATKNNPETNYKVYDFTFMKPINFDGAFKTVADNGRNKYNARIEIPNEDAEVLREIGIEVDNSQRPDADINEGMHTQTRTIEDTSLDYYAFRMGLNYDNIKKTDNLHLRKFLLSNAGNYYMPQYENSFYFFFGLKAGATAIDEFNKEFFATCNTNQLISAEPSLSLFQSGEINMCNATGSISVIINNMALPYTQIEYWKNGSSYKTIIKSDNDTENLLNAYSFTRQNLELGIYYFSVTDANGVTITDSIEIGGNIATYSYVLHNFNGVVDENDDDNDSLFYRGGYIEIMGLTVTGLPEGITMAVRLADEYGNYLRNDGSHIENYVNGSGELIQLKCDKGNIVRTVKVIYDCSSVGGTGTSQSVSIFSFMLKDGNSIKLYMGFNGGTQFPLVPEKYSNTNWWKNEPNGRLGTVNNSEEWINEYCTFNTIVNERRGIDIFSNNVVCEGGTKVIWGIPQNNKGLSSTNGFYKTYCTENYSDIPEGYSLDDEASYWSTYLPETGNSTGIIHYSAQAYNGTMVYGDYYAKLSGGTIKDATTSYFNVGYGYIFKPLPEGNLQFLTYDGSLETEFYDENGERYLNGLYYPSYIYPVISRPFYASAVCFVWQSKELQLFDGANNFLPELVVTEKNGKTEIHIYNGITSGTQRYFGESSYITNIQEIDRDTGLTNVIKAKASDLDGIEAKRNRDTYLSGITENDGVYGVADKPYFEYAIYDSTFEEGTTHANNITEYVSFTFANQLYLQEVKDGGAPIAIVNEDEDSTDDDIEYKIACCRNGSYNMIVSTSSINWPNGVYCANSPDNNNITYIIMKNNTTGEDELMKVIVDWSAFDDDRNNAKFRCSAESVEGSYSKSYEEAVKTKKGVQDFWKNGHNWGPGKNTARKLWPQHYITDGDPKWGTNLWNNKVWPTVLSDYSLVAQTSINTSATNWEQAIIKDINANNGSKKENYTYYGVGIKTNILNGNTTKIYKIYPFLNEVNTAATIPVLITISQTEINFDYEEDSATITVYGTTMRPWTATVDLDIPEELDGVDLTDEEIAKYIWASVDPVTAQVNEEEVTISVGKNDGAEDRTTTVTFGTSDGTEWAAVLTINQRGKSVPFVFSPSEVTFPYTGGTAKVTITTNPQYKWEVNLEGAGWLDPDNPITPSSGEGKSSYTITLKAQANTFPDAATGKIIFTSADERVAPAELIINQEGNPDAQSA